MSESQRVMSPTVKKTALKRWLGFTILWVLTALSLYAVQFFLTEQALTIMRQESLRSVSVTHIQQLKERHQALESSLLALERSVSEVQAHIVSLNTLFQDLSKIRSDWLLSEVSHSLALASQELQLAGNVSVAIAALHLVENRLAQFDRPELIGVKKAIASDLEALKAIPPLDIVGLTVKLDQLTQEIDALPLIIDARHAYPLPSTDTAPEHSFWSQFFKDMVHSLGTMVSIRRIDQAEVVLLSPEQSFVLRENIKLRLLDARIALLTRNASSYDADISAVGLYIERFFDRTDPATVHCLSSLVELKKVALGVVLPDLSASLKAINQAQATAQGEPS